MKSFSLLAAASSLLLASCLPAGVLAKQDCTTFGIAGVETSISFDTTVLNVAGVNFPQNVVVQVTGSDLVTSQVKPSFNNGTNLIVSLPNLLAPKNYVAEVFNTDTKGSNTCSIQTTFTATPPSAPVAPIINVIKTVNDLVHRTDIEVTAASFSAGTFPITKPGRYVLTENIVFTPTASGQAAITIGADDVTLDLNGHTLSGEQSAASTAFSNVVGVQVLGVSTNTIIQGGTLTGFSGTAILISAGAKDVVISHVVGQKSGFNGGYLGGSVFVRPFAGGLVALGEVNNKIQNVRVVDSEFGRITAAFPVPASGVPQGGANGISAIYVQNFEVYRSLFTDFVSNDAAAGLFFGICDNVVLKDLTISRATGDRNANGVDSNAGVSRANHRVHAENVYISDIIAVARGNEALGFEINGEDFVLKNVYVSNVVNTVTGTVPNVNRAIGFKMASNRGLVENCEAINISAASGERATGFAAETRDKAQFITFKNCKAKDISTSNAAAESEGFRAWQGATNIIFDECTAEKVFAATPSKAAGFLLKGVIEATVQNSIARGGNGHGILVADDPINGPVTTAALGPNFSSGIVVSNNLVSGNGVSGITDQSASQSGVYYSNRAIKNNNNNYALPAGNPIRTWTVGSSPAFANNAGAASDPLDNISVL